MKFTLVMSGYPPEVGGVEQYVDRLTRGSPASPATPMYSPSPRYKHGVGDLPSTRCPRTSMSCASMTGPTPGNSVSQGGSGRPSMSIVTPTTSSARTTSMRCPLVVIAVATHAQIVFSLSCHRVGHTASSRSLHFPYQLVAGRIFSRPYAVKCISEAELTRVVEFERRWKCSVGSW